MIRSHVCRQCRARLLPRAHPQWQPKATFISLRKLPQPPPDVPPTEPIPDRDVLPAHGAQNPSDPPGGRWSIRRGRYSQREHGVIAPQSGHGEAVADDELSADATEAIMATLPPAQAIEHALANRNVKRSWALFLEHYPSRDCPALTSPAVDDISLLQEGRVFLHLSTAVNNVFCRHSAPAVTPTHVLFRFAQLGIDSPKVWTRSIGHITDQLLWAVRDGRVEGVGRLPSADALLKELLSLWRLLFQCKGEKQDPLQDIRAHWPDIPDMGTLMSDRSWSSAGRYRMEQHHPQLITNPALQFSAIALFNLFDDVNQDSFKVSDALKEEAAPFIRLVTSTVAGMPTGLALRHIDYSQSFKHLPEDFKNAVIEQVRSAPVYAMKSALAQQPQRPGGPSRKPKNPVNSSKEYRTPQESPRQPIAQETSPQPNHQDDALATSTINVNEAPDADRMIGYYITKIDKAVTQRSHLGLLEGIWRNIIKAYGKPDNTTDIPPVLYSSLLSGFMNLHQPQQAATVWNHMIANGVRPDLRTWNAMLDGCIAAKDYSGFNGIWERMLKSGEIPDIKAWTTRIHGLASFNELGMTYAALDEMGNQWLAAERSMKQAPKPTKRGRPTPTPPIIKANNLPKPTIEVINGALSAIQQIPVKRLRFREKLDSMQKILRWAGQFDIKADVRTYNILMQLYIGENDYTTVFKLLRQMEGEGLEGDLVTHSLLIRSAFNSHKFDDLPASEQAEHILDLFSELEAGGLELSDRIYSIVIDRLLKVYGNLPAVRVVMDHMSSRNITPEPAVFTALITHYFQESPPNVEAVDSLLLRIFSSTRERTDKVFFDRVIEGYAKLGLIGRMMSVLTRMSGIDGKLPGYRALTEVVRALVAAGDWPRARALVKDVQNGEGVAWAGLTGGKQDAGRFFQAVKNLDITLVEPQAGEHPQATNPADPGSRQEAMQSSGASDDVDEAVGSTYQPLESSSESTPSNNGMDSKGGSIAKEEGRLGQVGAENDDEYVHADHTGYLVDEQQQPPKP